MPIYEYQCNSCGVEHDAFLSAPPPEETDLDCPECGAITLHRRRWSLNIGHVEGAGFSPARFSKKDRNG